MKKYPILTSAEEQLILNDWNDTKGDYPADLCFYQLWEEQVVKTPTATAIVFNDHQASINHEQLNRRANQLARKLQSLGVTQGSLRVSLG